MKESWDRRFTTSLDSFADRLWGDRAHFHVSLERAFAALTESERTAFDVGWHALAKHYVGKALRHLEALAEGCGTPIEEMMLFALCIVCHEYADNVRYEYQGHKFGDLECGIDSLKIEPQAQLGAYRVDFLVSYGAFVRLARAEQEKTRRSGAFEWASERLVIECDGHAFHERTKAQAAADRKRDRELQAQGLQVFRYTGSEIWRDVFAHAEESVRALKIRVGGAD